MGTKASMQIIEEGAVKVVKRPGVLADLALAAPTTVNLFRILSGPIEVLGFHGKVVTVMSAGAVTLAINLTTTLTGTVVPMAIATAALNGHQVETVYTLTGAVGAALNITATGAARGVGIYLLTNKQVLVPGVISMLVAAAANTGIIDWYIQYRSLGNGAVVVPA